MGDMEVMVDMDMVDTVAREKPKLNPKPGTVTSVTDTVPDTVFLDTELDTLDMEDTDSDMPVAMEVTDSDMPVVMEVTVLDTAMVDAVARDPVKPGVYMDVAMEVMVDTPVDTVMVDTAVDTVMVDTDGKHFQPNSPKKPFYTKFCHFYYCRNE